MAGNWKPGGDAFYFGAACQSGVQTPLEKFHEPHLKVDSSAKFAAKTEFSL